MLCRFWNKKLLQQSHRIVSTCLMSSSSNELFTNELLRQRLSQYLDKTPSYVDELSETVPKLKRSRRASVLVPLYCNPTTNRVEVLLIKRSETIRSHTGMIGLLFQTLQKQNSIIFFSICSAFPGGIADPTDRDVVHTAEREAFEEIGLEPHQYSVVGCLLPLTDSRLVVVTPVVALLHHPKFTDFRLSVDEASDAFYVDLEQFLFDNENYKMIEVGDDFVTHHFDIDKYHIWGLTAYELIIIATLVYQRAPPFPMYRNEKYLALKTVMQQQKDFFRLCVDLRYRDQMKQKSQL